MPLVQPRLTTRSAMRQEIRACLALSWPLIVTNAIEMAMNLTSAAMVGRIGPQALAACMLGMAFNSLFLLFGIGLTAAVSPLVARELGRRADNSAVRRTVQQGFWGAAIVAGPIWAVLWNAEPILTALGQDPALSRAAATYLHALQWSILPALFYLVLRSFFAALQAPRWAVATGIAAVALNVLLNWLLIDGHFGLPAWGLFGSGVATLLSNMFMASALGLVAVLDPRFRGFQVFSGVLRPRMSGFGAFWRLGLPIGVSLLLEAGMFSGATALVGVFGPAPLAAHAVALQAATFTFMVPLGLAQAATVRIGRALGAGDGAAVVRAGWTALGLGVGAMAILAVVLVSVPRWIIGLFVDVAQPGGGDVEPIAILLLGLAALFQIADGGQVVLSGMLRGIQDTRVPMVISAIGYWGVGLPVGAVLASWFGLGAPGVWIGMTVGLFTVAGLLLGRWRQKLRPSALTGAFDGKVARSAG